MKFDTLRWSHNKLSFRCYCNTNFPTNLPFNISVSFKKFPNLIFVYWKSISILFAKTQKWIFSRSMAFCNVKTLKSPWKCVPKYDFCAKIIKSQATSSPSERLIGVLFWNQSISSEQFLIWPIKNLFGSSISMDNYYQLKSYSTISIDLKIYFLARFI
jgi:hypothetical protein